MKISAACVPTESLVWLGILSIDCDGLYAEARFVVKLQTPEGNYFVRSDHGSPRLPLSSELWVI